MKNSTISTRHRDNEKSHPARMALFIVLHDFFHIVLKPDAVQNGGPPSELFRHV